MFSMSLVLEYISETQMLDEDLNYIENSFIPSIELSVWTMDEIQIRSQLHGILSSQNIVRASVRGEKMKEYDESKDITQYNEVFTKEYNLFYRGDQKLLFLGQLTLYITKDLIYKRIQESILRIFLTQSLKTFIISFILILAFQRIVSIHLKKIADYIKKYKVASESMEPLLLDKVSTTNYDEIDQVVDAINSMYSKSIKYQNELIELKEKAQHSSQVKNLFLASMSHELRTPLNAILGMTEILKEFPLTGEYKKYLDIQQSSGEHLRHLIDDILDLSKIEAGELKIEENAYSIFEVIQICQTMISSAVQEKKNEFKINLPNKFPKLIFGDKNRVMQIIINLLTNANKFTNQNLISLELSYDSLFFEIKVSDKGIGIPAHEISEIFSPFRQAKNALKITHKGAGIGLAICKNLVEQMGGGIEVESKVGFGTVFKVKLPLKEADPEWIIPNSVFPLENKNELDVSKNSTQNKADKVEINMSNNEKESTGLTHVPIPSLNSDLAENKNEVNSHVLIVEDNMDNQVLFKAYLKNQKLNLHFANDGKEAIEMFSKQKFDLIYMDLQMPNVNGYEATKEIRAIESKNANGLKTPIIALTAFTNKNELEAALEVGCDSYLVKPIKKVQLIADINERLQSKLLNQPKVS